LRLEQRVERLDREQLIADAAGGGFDERVLHGEPGSM
jgi:hypothetical protein